MTLYAVALSNGQETTRATANTRKRSFRLARREGRCYLVSIRKTWRTYLAHSIKRADAPTLGHCVRAVASVR